MVKLVIEDYDTFWKSVFFSSHTYGAYIVRENCLQHIVEQFLKILVVSFSKELQNVDEEEDEDN